MSQKHSKKKKDAVDFGILFNANYLILYFNFFFLGESISKIPSPMSRKSRSPSSISTAIITATNATPEVERVIFLINDRILRESRHIARMKSTLTIE